MKKLLFPILLLIAFQASAQIQLLEALRQEQVSDQQSGYDPDAQAFIAAVGTLTTPQQEAINDLVLGFKANGTWDNYFAIYPMIGGTAAAHKWNLKDPRDLDAAFRLTFNGGWTHTEDGARANGTNGWANTHFVDSEHLDFVDGNVDVLGHYYSNLDVPQSQPGSAVMGANGTGGASNDFAMLINQQNSGFTGQPYATSSWGQQGEDDNTYMLTMKAQGGIARAFRDGVQDGIDRNQGAAAPNGYPWAINSLSDANGGIATNMDSHRCAFAAIAGGGGTQTRTC